MTSLDRLVHDLSGEGTQAARDESTAAVLIRSRNGQPIDPAVRLSITDQQFSQYLAQTSGSASIVFPDVEPLVAAYRLFLANLDEVLATKALPGSEVPIQGDVLTTRPERPIEVFDLPGAGSYTWKAHPRP